MKKDPVTICLLCDYYGELLTDTQRRCIQLHYDQDLSLAEIAEREGISRQGVHATLSRAGAALTVYEEKLGCLRRARANQSAREAIRTAATRIAARGGPSETDAAAILEALSLMED